MRYLIMLLFLLTGCGNMSSIKEGDCIYDNYRVIKVVKVGKYSFQAIDKYGERYLYSFDIHYLQKVDCFDIFDHIKENKQ